MASSEIIQQSFEALFPRKPWKYDGEVKYSGKFRPYNAYVRMRGPSLIFSFSMSWREVSTDIQIGLLQTLMAKLWKKDVSARTMNMDLYDAFMKSLAEFTPKDNIDPQLQESFDRVNALMLEKSLPLANLVWGDAATTKLGHYEYATDTIIMSSIFRNAPARLLDLVMYHEMLHKKHKYKSGKTRTRHHSAAFRHEERLFPDFAGVDKELQRFVGSKKRAHSGFSKTGFFWE